MMSLFIIGFGAQVEVWSEPQTGSDAGDTRNAKPETGIVGLSPAVLPEAEGLDRATFGAGCFWGVEKAFQNIDGVVEAISGYAGGDTEAPTYTEVCSGTTGHAEVVQVFYDPETVSYDDLLETYWTLGNPSGKLNDWQSEYQYRHTILYYDEEQKRKAEDAIKRITQETGTELAVFLEPLETFFPAEEYHQDFYFKLME